MKKLNLSEEAKADLAEIKTYIAQELGSPDAAKNTVRRITKDMRLLRDYPAAGAPLSSVAEKESDYRFLVSGNYLVFYRVRGTDVYVDRVMYGRRACLSALFGGKIGTE